MENKKVKTRLVMGDIHTHFDTLFEIYNKVKPDSVIILGDYFDSFSRPPYETQIKGFEDLIKLKKEHESKNIGDFILILGNHDFHYSNFCTDTYSGFNQDIKNNGRQLITDAIIDGTLTVAFIDELNKCIYSHAGVTKYWFENVLVANGSLSEINNVEKIQSLNFNWITGFNNYGNTISQSPIWVRPDSLISNHLEGWNQVVGHTHTKGPIIHDLEDNVKLYVIDTLPEHYIIEELDENNVLIERKIVYNGKE